MTCRNKWTQWPPIFHYWILTSMIGCNFLQSLKYYVEWVPSQLNIWNFKVALKPFHIIFLSPRKLHTIKIYVLLSGGSCFELRLIKICVFWFQNLSYTRQGKEDHISWYSSTLARIVRISCAKLVFHISTCSRRIFLCVQTFTVFHNLVDDMGSEPKTMVWGKETSILWEGCSKMYQLGFVHQ